MQYLGSLGSVILLWSNPYLEFYYHKLHNGVHYLEVNASNIEHTIRWLRHNDDNARRLASNLNRFVRHELCRHKIQSYNLEIFTAYNRLQNFVPTSVVWDNFS